MQGQWTPGTGGPTMGIVEGPAPTPRYLRSAGLPLAVGGVGCIVGGLAGLFLAHNTSSARVPFSVFALLFGCGCLLGSIVLLVRYRG